MSEVDILAPPIEAEVVACLGPEYTYSHIIAERMVSDGTIVPSHLGSGDIRFELNNDFRFIESTLSQYHQRRIHAVGILPVQNTLAPPVRKVLDILVNGRLNILKEASLEIDLVVAGTGLSADEVEIAYSHEKGLDEAAVYIDERKIQPKLSFSTSLAAEEAAEEADPRVAAICSREAAEFWGLNILDEGVQSEYNKTRFLVVQARARGVIPSNKKLLEWLKSGEIDSRERLKIVGVAHPHSHAAYGKFLDDLKRKESKRLAKMDPEIRRVLRKDRSQTVRYDVVAEDTSRERHFFVFSGPAGRLLSEDNLRRRNMEVTRLGIFRPGKLYPANIEDPIEPVESAGNYS